MYDDATMYNRYHNMQERDTKILLSNICPKMKWEKNGEIVMDIGCGTGDNTLKVLLSSFPDVELIVAVDILPKMIEFARSHNAHPLIQYQVADIEDRNSLLHWKGKISKVFSIYCINWVIDQEQAFRNIFHILRNGGEAALVFVLQSQFFHHLPEIVASPKWNKYLKNVNYYIPDSYSKGYGSSYYSELLKRVGFEVMVCETEKRYYTYSSDAECREALSRCGLTRHIPEDVREGFKDDIFKAFLRNNGRNEEGRVSLHYCSLTLHIRKSSSYQS